MSEQRDKQYDYLHYLPKNYTNAGGFLNGLFSMETFKQLLIMLGGFYILTEFFLRPVATGGVLWGVRIGYAFFVIILHFAVGIIFNSTIQDFILSIYDYIKSIKQYRYERRDLTYVKRVEATKKTSSTRRKDNSK